MARLNPLLLAALLLVCRASFPAPEAVHNIPLGKILASDQVMIGDAQAPPGTTLFAGDRVRSRGRALLDLGERGRMELIGASVVLDRDGGGLIIRQDKGAIRFSLYRGPGLTIDTGSHILKASGQARHTGELAIQSRYRVEARITEGAFAVLNRNTGGRLIVNSTAPFTAMPAGGEGKILQNGQTLQDEALNLKPDELHSKCVVVGKEAYPITSNSRNVITINGSWKAQTGKHAYNIVECTEEALIQAGASEEAAKNAVILNVFGSLPAKPSHRTRNTVVAVAVGATAAAVPLAIKSAGGEEKSPSSR